MADIKGAERRLLTSLDLAVELAVRRGLSPEHAMVVVAAHGAGGYASLAGRARAAAFAHQLASDIDALPREAQKPATPSPCVTRPGQ